MSKHILSETTSERSSSQEVLFLLTLAPIAYFSEGSSKNGDLFSNRFSFCAAELGQTLRRHSHLVGTGSNDSDTYRQKIERYKTGDNMAEKFFPGSL